jgi:hypothetical protein
VSGQVSPLGRASHLAREARLDGQSGAKRPAGEAARAFACTTGSCSWSPRLADRSIQLRVVDANDRRFSGHGRAWSSFARTSP